MADIESIVQELKRERDRLDAAIRALTSVNGSGRGNHSGSSGKRRLSAAARQRIAAAQRARWARIRAKQK
jgi:exonuclease VII small subunit